MHPACWLQFGAGAVVDLRLVPRRPSALRSDRCALEEWLCEVAHEPRTCPRGAHNPRVGMACRQCNLSALIVWGEVHPVVHRRPRQAVQPWYVCGHVRSLLQCAVSADSLPTPSLSSGKMPCAYRAPYCWGIPCDKTRKSVPWLVVCVRYRVRTEEVIEAHTTRLSEIHTTLLICQD